MTDDDAEIARLLEQGAGTRGVIPRVKHFAGALLGRPYLADPLVGGPDTPEALVTGMSGFDCVTFVETVLALARSRTREEFRDELIQLRYRGGSIQWKERLHYFSDWFVENARRGVLRIDTAGPGAQPLDKTLSLLAGLPPRATRFDVIPADALDLALPRITDGSIAAFASERDGLDYFHVGLLFFEEQLVMVHAAKSLGCAGKETLAAFLARNRTRGISLARPLELQRTIS